MKEKEVVKRIMIFGRGGSGKSTFASHLHHNTKIPLYHLDRYFYLSNWQERNYQEFMLFQSRLVEKETWIIDGNCTKSFEMRYAKADLVVYFNFSRWICFWRIFKRRVRKNKKIDDRPSHCKERVTLRFLQYVWGFDNRVSTQLTYLKEKYPNVYFTEVNSDRDVKMLNKKTYKKLACPEA